MSFASEASKLLTNKYFLYFMVFLSATNVLGYLVTNKLNAVAFFALVSLLTYHFSKNMAVILLVAVIMTNFMMSNRLLREGLETQGDAAKTAQEKVAEKAEKIDPEIASTLPIVQKAKTNEEVKNTIATVATTPPPVSDVNNQDLNTSTADPNAPEGFGEKIASKKGSVKSEHFGPRLDYAATIEQSYQNLDSILGSDSIKQLTNDTQKLMAQQQNLFNTMNQMVPVLEGAQGLLEKFNIGDLQKSLQSISGLGKAPTIAGK